MRSSRYDAVVVGAGPNGLAAAIELARAGRSTLLLEAEPTVGGGVRSLPLTLPGYVHDLGAAIMPLGVASPFLRSLPLHDHCLTWVSPPVALAHPLDDGSAAILERSIGRTAASLGPDEAAYARLMEPLVRSWSRLETTLLGPPRLPRHPIALARFGAPAVLPATVLAHAMFRGEHARALFAGLAAHSFVRLDRPPTGAFGLLLGMLGHAVGWPFPEGGAQRLSDAMRAYFEALGGEVVTGVRVRSMSDIPPARAILFDLAPAHLLRIAGERLPPRYCRALQRYRYGPGVFKVDYALSGSVPWRAPRVAQAGTVHLGGTLDDIAAAERDVARGRHPDRPFVLLAQHTPFDPSRAPPGRHTLWAYCHVPNGSTVDMTERIDAQIERFAPGFRDLILARHVLAPRDLERLDANLIGGDITGGLQNLRQVITRPTFSLSPYRMPASGLYLCSASTPPGGGVHGMCGFHAARAALGRELR